MVVTPDQSGVVHSIAWRTCRLRQTGSGTLGHCLAGDEGDVENGTSAAGVPPDVDDVERPAPSRAHAFVAEWSMPKKFAVADRRLRGAPKPEAPRGTEER